jgi:hypothetical protein
MRPQKASERAVRIRGFVGVLVMAAMNADPARRRILDAANTKERKTMFQPFGTDQAAVREHAMEAKADPERAEDIEP